jgi:membrane protein
VKQLRIFTLAFKGFTEDRVQVRASALTYYTLLSLVPIAAMVFGIAKAFGFDERLRTAIVEGFESQTEVSMYILNFAENILAISKEVLLQGLV